MSLFENLLSVLEAEDVKYQADAERRVVRSGMRMPHGLFRVYMQADEEQQVFQVFIPVPVTVPEGCRLAIAEATTRANYGLKVGKFELDFSDGELRFQAAAPLPAGTIHGEIVHRMLGTAAHFVNLYFPAFMSIIYANEAPEEAVGRVDRMAG